MSTRLHRAAARGRLHHIALTGLVSLALVGAAGVASAQEAAQDDSSTTVTTTSTQAAEEDSTETTETSSSESSSSESSSSESSSESSTATEEPEPSLTPFDVSVLTDCFPDGFGQATVFLRISEQENVRFVVTLGKDEQVATFDDEAGFYFAEFGEVSAGIHKVTVTGSDGSEVVTEANLEGCEEDHPRPDDKLIVSVKCVDGAGVVTIQVYNPDTEDSKFLTIKVNDFGALPPYEDFEFFPDVIAKITEIAEDGTYEIQLFQGKRLIDSETITVACEETPTTTTSASETTTTAPPAQGGTPPSTGLPNTGAAVRGIAVLGVIALLLGAALVYVGRRRRTATTEGPEA